MIINTIPTTQCQPQTIVIGRRGTYDTMQIAFDLSYLVESYGNGVAVLAVKRSQDESAYPAIVTQEDATLLWIVNETDTAYVGSGECQLMWYVDGGLAKTIIYPMVVMRDILQTAEQPPDGYENWIEHLTELGAETQQNAQNAAQSASDAEQSATDAGAAKDAANEAVLHYPKIENGYWYVWDVTAQAYQNTNIKAEGDDGYSPEVTITSIEGGHRITITDKDHPQGQSFDVLDGHGGGGTSDYTDLTNKPQINGHTLTGNQTAEQLDLATPSDIPTDAGDIEYDESATYQAGSVGAELQEQNRQLRDKQDAPANAGTAGQVLGLDDQLQPVWTDGGSSEDAAPVIINTASGNIASFADGADNRQIKKIVGTIVPVQSGSGDPSPDNVRPISGWTGANITGAGINIWDEEWENGYWDTTTGEPVTANNYIRCKNFIRVTPNTVYRISVGKTDTQQNQAIWFDESYNIIGHPTFAPNVTITSPANAKYLKFYMNWHYGNVYENDISINYPALYTGYYPHGTTLPINWQSEAGTIYGGTVTLNEDGSADVVATCAKWIEDGSREPAIMYTGEDDSGYKTIDGVVYNYGWFSALPAEVRNKVYGANEVPPVLVCNQCIKKSAGSSAFYGPSISIYAGTAYSEQVLLPRDLIGSTKASFAAYLSDHPLEFVYELATPQTYHFSNIGSLLTYYGQNNVWIDTGSITECDYPADTKLYIDGITAPDEDMIANSNIASGKYFVVNNQLYLSTAAIAAGASIVPGTNCTATNLAAALNSLNS